MKPDENGKYTTEKLSPKMSHIIKIVLGLYLFYLVYELRENFYLPIQKENLLFVIASIVFSVVAVIIIFFSAKNLIIGKYKGGALDAGMAGTSANEAQTDKLNADTECDPHNVVYKEK